MKRGLRYDLAASPSAPWLFEQRTECHNKISSRIDSVLKHHAHPFTQVGGFEAYLLADEQEDGPADTYRQVTQIAINAKKQRFDVYSLRKCAGALCACATPHAGHLT